MTQAAKRPDFDPDRAQTFAEKLLTALNHGALCLMVSIGHRTGLFDTMRTLPPATSNKVATGAGLNERYVREWLGAMVTGGVVEFDAATRRYSLPAEHAASLTRAANADNMAVFAQYIPGLAGVEDEIIECFRHGGGVPYSSYPRFHEVMAEDSGQSVLSSLEAHILPLVPGLTGRLAQGIRVLDAGCGRGRVLLQLAALYPRSRFTGLDLSEEAIDYARAAARAKGLTNVEYIAANLSDFDRTAEPEAFDFITTFDAIHDQGRPLNVLKGIHRALKAEGVYLMQDISGTGHVHKDVHHPLGTLLYTVSCLHCMTVSLAQGGEGLGATWGEEKTIEYLKRAGFPLDHQEPPGARYPEQLVHRREVARLDRRRAAGKARPRGASAGPHRGLDPALDRDLVLDAGIEFVLTGARENAEQELGIERCTEPESAESADVFADPRLRESGKRLSPLLRGDWR